MVKDVNEPSNSSSITLSLLQKIHYYNAKINHVYHLLTYSQIFRYYWTIHQYMASATKNNKEEHPE